MANVVNPTTNIQDEELEKALDSIGVQSAPVAPSPAPVTPAEPVAPTPTPVPVTEPAPEPAPAPQPTSASSPSLDSVRINALAELKPLISKVDLPAEERFYTIMMIIQATDDKSLVQLAYDAATAIEDEQKKAQALLDIIKEIEYLSRA